MAYRILLVEDEPLIAMHLEDIIMDLGHSVVGVAANADAAFAAASVLPSPDIAFACIDLGLRGDVLPAILRLRDELDVSIVFIGSSWTDRQELLMQVIHPEALVPKPFTSAQVAVAISKVACDQTALAR